MIGKSKKLFTMFFSLMLVTGLLFISFSASVCAENSKGDMPDKKKAALSRLSSSDEGASEHADIDTFQKNYSLSVAEKEYTITEIENAVSKLLKPKLLKPEMSDLEKYYTLAIWARQQVVYDWDFWSGSYNFDYYSHQWDAYGAIAEGEKSVCVGVSIFYANLCHAADLPCRFVRFDPSSAEHTIDYIPDINGNAYFVDITENDFLMSEDVYSFGQYIDRKFAHITQDCTDSTFNYRNYEGDKSLHSVSIIDLYNVSYADWFNEYALHQNTTKLFDTDYVEKGSGRTSDEEGYYHASYRNPKYPSNFVEKGDVWFLDDFYKDPVDIKDKILRKELDKELLDVSGVKSNYDCDDADDLETAIAQDISVKYFPTSEEGEIVAKSAELVNGEDYKVICDDFDAVANTADIIVRGINAYTGEYRFRVTIHSAAVIKAPVRRNGLVYNGASQELVEPGEANNGVMLYALGTQTEPTEGFSTAIPKAANAGRYYVWYKVAGDEAHGDSQPQCIEKVALITPKQLNIIAEDMTIKVGETAVISPELDEELPARFTFFKLDREGVISLTEEGEVTGVKEGSASVYVNCRLKYSSPNYDNPLSKAFLITVKSDISGSEVVLSESAFTYNGKVQKPSIKTINGLELTAGTDYTVKWPNTSSKNVGTYTVTITGKGSYTGTTKAKYKIYPKKITPSVRLSAASYTWNGKAKKPVVTVKDGSTKLAAYQYSVKYASGRKNVGKYRVKVTLNGNYSGAKTVYFKINPKGTRLKTLKKASKALTIKWMKQVSKMSASRITGYQIQLATDSKFTKNKKLVMVKGYSQVSRKVTGLKGGKKYYVRIRTYMTVSGRKYYSPWSKVKTVTTKK